MLEAPADERHAEVDGDGPLMARQPSLTSTSGTFQHQSEEEKRAYIREEGKKWAESVTAENAWDKLVLTLGEPLFSLFAGGQIRIPSRLRPLLLLLDMSLENTTIFSQYICAGDFAVL